MHTYVTTALEQLSKISDPKGVIIDLRGNTGGNMMPMLGHALLSLKKVNYSNLLL
ncbi:S41 family peptidase [Enterococcus gallinarum]|nr:S41 family peptidase [Enterococcus gallinarum]